MKTYLLLITIVITASACRKERNYQVTLPEETTSGQNTLGFLYGHGSVWSSIEHGIFWFGNHPDNTPNATCIIYQWPTGRKTIQISGTMRIKDKEANIVNNSDIQITLQNTGLTSRDFSFDTTRTDNWVHFTDNILHKGYSNYTNNSFALQITTLDTTEKIISGNFHGTLFKANGTVLFSDDSLSLQSGRFDIKYTTY